MITIVIKLTWEEEEKCKNNTGSRRTVWQIPWKEDSGMGRDMCTQARQPGGREGFTPAEGKTSGQRERWTSSGQPRRVDRPWRKQATPKWSNIYQQIINRDFLQPWRMDVGGLWWSERCVLVGCPHDAVAWSIRSFCPPRPFVLRIRTRTDCS